MIYGYIRSKETSGPTTAVEQITLEREGCSKLFIDEGITDIAVVRPEWEAMCSVLCPGDCVVVQSFSVLSRNVSTLLEDLSALNVRQVDIRFLDEQIDTRRSEGAGAMELAVRLAQLNAMNRDYARSLPDEEPAPRGRPSSINGELGLKIEAELSAGDSVSAVARNNGVSRAAIYRWRDAQDIRQAP